ncbi:MAG: preprotein translocase subunit SecG [Alphaproteobacteria bacterium]|nr:preprotein translocase subunit SecG [Alphaproteobacteria bacterium]
MQSVLLVVHLIVALALIGLVMLQRSEGGALGIGGGSGNLFSSRGVGNTLTRATAILAACFFATSVALTMLANHKGSSTSIIGTGTPSTTAPTSGGTGGTTAPAAPSGEGLLPKLDPSKPVVPTN